MVQLTPGDLEKLLGNGVVPGSYQEQQVLSAWLENIIHTKGERYIRRNRKKLLHNWVEILRYGLARI